MREQVSIKSKSEIIKMRVAGKLAAGTLDMIEPYIKVGVTTNELNDICHEYITKELEAYPAPLNYKCSDDVMPFPKSICTSVNHQVCHGFPDDRRLKDGDLLNIDVTVRKDGYHGDTNKTFLIGGASVKAKRLTAVTQEAMYKAIKIVRPGTTLGDIGHIIQQHVEEQNFSVVREYCGHGIGKGFHEPPQVLHYGKPGEGLVLKEGMTFTIEPMINAGKRFVKVLKDGWIVVTKDRSLSAQFEHTILVTESGYEVLTKRIEEVI